MTRHIRIVALAIAISIALVVAPLRGEQAATDFDSPRLAELAKQLTDDAAANQALVDNFVNELRGKTPIIEPVADDPHSSWVTFLWLGESDTKGVAVLGGPPTADFGAKLTRLGNTSLWYRTDRLPNDARFAYRFMINVPDKVVQDEKAFERLWKKNPPRGDPLNKHSLAGGDASFAELPEARPEPWLQRVPGVPNDVANWLEKTLAGREIKEATLKSNALDQERRFAVYTPPGYDAKGEPCRVLVMFDGNGCRVVKDNPFPVAIILDSLIQQKEIPPVVAVFVFQTEKRNNELSCSETFADFVANELLPRVRKDYRVTSDPSRTIVCGMSLGGLMSSYCAYRHPDVFGNVLSLSGSYQWFPGAFEGTAPRDAEPGWLTRQFVAAPQKEIRFYLTAGRFENFFPLSLLAENRRFRDVLQAKGYGVKYGEFSGGHDPFGWRGAFVEGLTWLTSQPDKPSEKTAEKN